MAVRPVWPTRGIVIGRIVSRGALAVFTRQLATLVNAGLPLLRALDVLRRQETNRLFKETLAQVAETVRTGGSLSDGLRAHPKAFDRLYVNMVKAGEAGGALGLVLQRMALLLEKSERIKARVRAALVYPLVVVVVAVGIVAGLMVFVVPRFQEIFAGLLKGAPLPVLTQVVVGASLLLRNHFFMTIALVGGALAGVAVARRTRGGKRTGDWMLVRLPLVGSLFLKVAVARFARTFGTLLAGGVPILQALAITRETSANAHIAQAIGDVRERVKAGEALAAPLAASGVFPPMVTSMVEVGEETGALAEMLSRAADIYEDEVDVSVAALTSILEPVMVVFMALVVGVIVIALFLPIVRIIQAMT